jgi:hypothetical protein
MTQKPIINKLDRLSPQRLLCMNLTVESIGKEAPEYTRAVQGALQTATAMEHFKSGLPPLFPSCCSKS